MENVRGYNLITVVILFLLINHYTISQNFSIGAENGGQIQFNTYPELSGGKTKTNQINVRIQRYGNPNVNVAQWKLTARLSNDFINNQNQNYIPAQYAQLIFNQETNYSTNSSLINPSNIPVALSKFNEATLIESNVPLNPQTHRLLSFDLHMQGGTHLLTVPNGNYISSYEFRLYGRASGSDPYTLYKTVTSSNTPGIQMNYSGNYGSQSITMQNSADLYSFTFANVSDYINGKSINVNNGLKVTTYNNYQLSIKSSSNFFTSATSANTIPISRLWAELSLSSPVSNTQIYGPINITSTDQIIVNRTSNNPQSVEYNLRFFIPPNTMTTDDVSTTETLSAHVYFSIIPN